MSSFLRATRALALGTSASIPRAPRSGAARPHRPAQSPGFLVIVTAAAAASGLLLGACSSSAAPGAGKSAAHNGAVTGPIAAPAARAPAMSGHAAFDQLGLSSAGHAQLIRIVPPTQSLIYTANLTLRVKNVTATAAKMTSLVTSAGGYVAGQQETIQPGGHGAARVSLTLKIPAAAYHSTLAALATYGTQLHFDSQATDVTQQVADVTSRVASAQAAIRQLRALLARAGNVGSLLSVQNEINSQESALESLLAQQRALAHQTSYGTVSVLLVGHHVVVVKKPKKKSHGFLAGLGSGWRALTAAVEWLLNALGVVLPFAVIVALLAGIAIGGRRRLARRRTAPAAQPPTAPAS